MLCSGSEKEREREDEQHTTRRLGQHLSYSSFIKVCVVVEQVVGVGGALIMENEEGRFKMNLL